MVNHLLELLEDVGYCTSDRLLKDLWWEPSKTRHATPFLLLHGPSMWKVPKPRFSKVSTRWVLVTGSGVNFPSGVVPGPMSTDPHVHGLHNPFLHKQWTPTESPWATRNFVRTPSVPVAGPDIRECQGSRREKSFRHLSSTKVVLLGQDFRGPGSIPAEAGKDGVGTGDHLIDPRRRLCPVRFRRLAGVTSAS